MVASHPIRRREGARFAHPSLHACRDVERVVGTLLHVPVAELAARSRRSAPVALARQMAMYLARVVHGVSFRNIGQAFGRDARTVVHACRRIEDRRDDPRFDAVLARLEQASRAVASGDVP